MLARSSVRSRVVQRRVSASSSLSANALGGPRSSVLGPSLLQQDLGPRTEDLISQVRSSPYYGAGNSGLIQTLTAIRRSNQQGIRMAEQQNSTNTPTLEALPPAGVHCGPQTRRWNPKMRRFIFAER